MYCKIWIGKACDMTCDPIIIKKPECTMKHARNSMDFHFHELLTARGKSSFYLLLIDILVLNADFAKI
jgi:hypothetical protein